MYRYIYRDRKREMNYRMRFDRNREQGGFHCEAETMETAEMMAQMMKKQVGFEYGR